MSDGIMIVRYAGEQEHPSIPCTLATFHAVASEHRRDTSSRGERPNRAIEIEDADGTRISLNLDSVLYVVFTPNEVDE